MGVLCAQGRWRICPFARAGWSFFFHIFQLQWVMPHLVKALMENQQFGNPSQRGATLWNYEVVAILWSLWLKRNRTFHNLAYLAVRCCLVLSLLIVSWATATEVFVDFLSLIFGYESQYDDAKVLQFFGLFQVTVVGLLFFFHPFLFVCVWLDVFFFFLLGSESYFFLSNEIINYHIK